MSNLKRGPSVVFITDMLEYPLFSVGILLIFPLSLDGAFGPHADMRVYEVAAWE
jgi:hypothetical protein